ncbi:hypothetical protein HF325_002228 [Metschnikowia pulcherrima]|uniref:Uncharacterized protein n=1 Tax=Metschnikowia pulcherrima TaxID=27326 RepID=A0A8H7LCN2_9ASCO|nr:hypothetical protein HF325_002228 [Metschnikowia pulcherrima]
MRTCLTLVATAILSSLAAAAPMTDNVDGKVISKVVLPQVGSMKDADSESALFKRDENVAMSHAENVAFSQAQVARKIRDVIKRQMSLLVGTFDYENWDNSRASYERILSQIEDRVEDVKKLSGGNFDIEMQLNFLRNMQGAMTGIAEKIHDLGERDFAGKDLVKGMMLLSVEMWALFDVQGHADTLNPRFAKKYDDIKSRIASLMEGYKDEFLMNDALRDLFKEYTMRVNYRMGQVTRSMAKDGQKFMRFD